MSIRSNSRTNAPSSRLDVVLRAGRKQYPQKSKFHAKATAAIEAGMKNLPKMTKEDNDLYLQYAKEFRDDLNDGKLDAQELSKICGAYWLLIEKLKTQLEECEANEEERQNYQPFDPQPDGYDAFEPLAPGRVSNRKPPYEELKLPNLEPGELYEPSVHDRKSSKYKSTVFLITALSGFLALYSQMLAEAASSQSIQLTPDWKNPSNWGTF